MGSAQAGTLVRGAVPDEFQELCGRKSGQGVTLALPFDALAAGSRMVASLYQHASRALLDIGFMQMAFFGEQQRMTGLK
jgi:hypothetical protein